MAAPHRSRVLVVEDEAQIIEHILEAVREDDYHISATTSPLEALEISRHTEEKIDLLLVDMFMPEMDGETLAEAVRSLHPNVKVLLLTGLASEDQLQKWRNRRVKYVVKPFRFEELAAAVRSLLAGNS